MYFAVAINHFQFKAAESGISNEASQENVIIPFFLLYKSKCDGYVCKKKTLVLMFFGTGGNVKDIFSLL